MLFRAKSAQTSCFPAFSQPLSSGSVYSALYPATTCFKAPLMESFVQKNTSGEKKADVQFLHKRRAF